MKYISGIQALNIEDSLNTCGDWHTSAMDWSNLMLLESDGSLYEDWGIEKGKVIPEHSERYCVANTLRAILDLMLEDSSWGYLKGFRNDFLCTDEYNELFFSKVILMKDLPIWEKVDLLMEREFMLLWIEFIRRF